MDALEGDQALLDGERPLEHDGPYIALARDGAARLELGRGDPAVLIPHPAEQRPVCLPHHGHAPNLDRVESSYCMAVPFRSPRRAHVAKGKYPAVVPLRG